MEIESWMSPCQPVSALKSMMMVLTCSHTRMERRKNASLECSHDARGVERHIHRVKKSEIIAKNEEVEKCWYERVELSLWRSEVLMAALHRVQVRERASAAVMASTRESESQTCEEATFKIHFPFIKHSSNLKWEFDVQNAHHRTQDRSNWKSIFIIWQPSEREQLRQQE